MNGVDKEQEPVKSLACMPFPENLMVIELWTTPLTRERQMKDSMSMAFTGAKNQLATQTPACEANCENAKSLLRALSIAVLRRQHGLNL